MFDIIGESMTITFQDFTKVDIRVGKIIEVREFPEARSPAYRIRVDLGPEIGIKSSSAQLPKNYTPQDLLETLVLCVVNLPKKQIGPAISEVLVLGVPNQSGDAILISPRSEVPLGGRLF